MIQMLNLNFNILKTIIFKCRYYFAHKRVCFITYKSLKTVLIQVVLSLMILLFLNALEKIIHLLHLVQNGLEKH